MAAHPENPGNRGKGDHHTFSQDFQLANISARVPEKVARGVFSTGVLVLQGASEFVLDFVLRMNQPHQVAARVVLPINLVPQLIEALKSNLENYRQTFGVLPTMPTTASIGVPASREGAAPAELAGKGSAEASPSQPAGTRNDPPKPPAPAPGPSIEEIYQDLRVADDVLGGVYANSVMIVHTAAEFCLEFIANFYPKAALAARVFLSAPQVPILLQTLTQSWQKYQSRPGQ